ncbi:hypothetical protein [Salinarimonas sp.]|uniref:MotE family protein n=1 Tax=Salinarimonas sp. TaxID=2766526 RepID=UPI0032D95ACE
MRERGTPRLVAALALAAALVPAAAPAQSADPDATAPVVTVQPEDVALYCDAIRDAAHEARTTWQARALLEIEARIEARLADLERLRAETEAALARREEHLRQAEEGIVAIYARMRPDAAAAQLAALDSEMASAVLAKLAPRQASAILNEMEPGRAAQLARVATDTARDADDQPQEQSL